MCTIHDDKLPCKHCDYLGKYGDYYRCALVSCIYKEDGLNKKSKLNIKNILRLSNYK